MTLQTTRLRLRPFREDDVQAIYDNSAAPEVGLNAGWKPHESLTESYDVLHLMFLDQPTVWAARGRAADGLDRSDRGQCAAVRLSALGRLFARHGVLGQGLYDRGASRGHGIRL